MNNHEVKRLCVLPREVAWDVQNNYVIPPFIAPTSFEGGTLFVVKDTEVPVFFNSTDEVWYFPSRKIPISSTINLLAKIRGLGFIGEISFAKSVNFAPDKKVYSVDAVRKNGKPGSLSLSDTEGG